jgi:hypothetical protein
MTYCSYCIRPVMADSWFVSVLCCAVTKACSNDPIRPFKSVNTISLSRNRFRIDCSRFLILWYIYSKLPFICSSKTLKFSTIHSSTLFTYAFPAPSTCIFPFMTCCSISFSNRSNLLTIILLISSCGITDICICIICQKITHLQSFDEQIVSSFSKNNPSSFIRE